MHFIYIYLYSLSLKKVGTEGHTLRDPLIRKHFSVPFCCENPGTLEGHFEQSRNKFVNSTCMHAICEICVTVIKALSPKKILACMQKSSKIGTF